MSRWLRLYDDAINDTKILKLPEATRWHWVAVLCIASKHDGKLPPLADVALLLRLPESRAAKVLTTLAMAGLLDKTDEGFVPHNWGGRQYKSDVTDATNATRQKRYRERHRNAVTPVTPKRPDTEAETEDRIVEARGRASAFTEGSKALASAFWKALGFDGPLDIPPEFAGVDWRATEWETAGWTAEMIATEARRIGPGKPLSYHEKVFATAHAKLHAPLPKVEIREAETLQVTHGQAQRGSGSAASAFRELRQQIDCESIGRGEAGGSPVLRLSRG